MENYGRLDARTGTSSRVRDFLDRMDEVVDYALANRADVAIFSGDAFKTRDPDPTQQREFASRLKRLADNMPVLLLVGNHDLPGMASKATSVDIFDALDVPNVIVGSEPAGKVVVTQRGPFFLAWMPYPMRNRLLTQEQHRGKSVEELDQALRLAVATLVKDLSEQATEHKMPRVLSGHFSVAEAMLGSERSVMLGRDVAVYNSALAEPAWDYVALGHIHKHQDVNPGAYPSVVYPGSLERIDFGEEKEPKGFCWVNLVRGETKWKFVPVDARSFLTIRVDVRGSNDPTGAVMRAIEKSDVEGVVVRLILQLKADQSLALRDAEIDTALDAAYSHTVAREVDHEARTRIGGLAAETLTPSELLERYLLDKGYSDERIQPLLAVANGIFHGSDE
jgi:exonuclease SbcD